MIGKNLRSSALEELENEHGLGRAIGLGYDTGYFTKALAKVADSVMATDLCEETLARTRGRVKEVRNVTFQKEDCMLTSFPDDTFDTVLMALVFSAVPKEQQLYILRLKVNN